MSRQPRHDCEAAHGERKEKQLNSLPFLFCLLLVVGMMQERREITPEIPDDDKYGIFVS